MQIGKTAFKTSLLYKLRKILTPSIIKLNKDFS
ncbi:MAG: hypothetical protein K0Q53_40 [Massilibacillus sp.]|jgi:hypothetical protein|nr:hypothetical protein [Massilibacillus sp.]